MIQDIRCVCILGCVCVSIEHIDIHNLNTASCYRFTQIHANRIRTNDKMRDKHLNDVEHKI